MIVERIGSRLGAWRIWLYAALIGFSGGAHSSFHLWQINEIYSNASGTVQFIEFTTNSGGQQFLNGHAVTATSSFTFPNHLPGDSAGKKFLVGTAGFAALNIVAPDYIVPNGFLALPNGSINFASVDVVSYTSLPTNGVLSIDRSGTTATNSPTNFAGASGTITPMSTIPDPPIIGTAVAGNGQASVAFTPPGNDGGSAITGYTATCGTSNATGSASPITVTGLVNGIAVSCTVRATNAVGNSNPSAPSNSVTPLGPPGTPINVSATPGNAQVTMIFSPPTSNGGSAITGYTATCGGQNAIGGGSPLTVTSLTNGTTVTCTVLATNAQGNGVPSAGINVTPATVPGAPTIGTAIPGNGEAFISFTPPASNGGAAITGYTATCNPGAISATGTDSPITVGNLANMVLHSCTVLASNAIGQGTSSATADVTPLLSPPITPVAVYSRKTHTGLGALDLKIETGVAIGGAVSVEPRTIGSGHTIVFEFNAPVTSVTNVAVIPVGMVSALPPSGRQLAVALTGVPDNQRVTVSLTGVNGTGVNVDTSMGFLVGDVGGARAVNAADISSVKARQGQMIGLTNFRFDLNATGSIDLSDVSVVKARSGQTLP